MEPGGSLSYSQESTNGPYLEAVNPVHTIRSCLFKIYFNIIISSTLMSAKRSRT
jgi:hypothetical protein